MKPDPEERIGLYYTPKNEDHDPNEEYPFKYYRENPFYKDIKDFIPAEIFEAREQSNIIPLY